MRYIAFDAETTGFSHAKGDRLIELAAYEFDENGRVTGSLKMLVDPGKKIPYVVVSLTHITDQMVVGKATEEDAVAAFRAFVRGATLIGHGGDFDLKFITDIDPSLSTLTAYDTVKITRALFPTESHKLSEQAKLHLDRRWHTNPHRAWSDALATGKLFFEMRRYCENELSPEELAALRAAHPEQKDLLGAFLHSEVRTPSTPAPVMEPVATLTAYSNTLGISHRLIRIGRFELA